MPARLYAQHQGDRFAVPHLFLLTVSVNGEPPLKCSAFGRSLDEAIERTMEKFPALTDFSVITPE